MYMCTGHYLYTGLQKCMTGGLVRKVYRKSCCVFLFSNFRGRGVKHNFDPSPRNPEELRLGYCTYGT